MGRRHCEKRKNCCSRPLCFQKICSAGTYKPGLVLERVKSLSNDKILDMDKLRVFADDKINVAQIMISVFDRIENIVGKGENVGFFFKVVKSPDCLVKN